MPLKRSAAKSIWRSLPTALVVLAFLAIVFSSFVKAGLRHLFASDQAPDIQVPSQYVEDLAGVIDQPSRTKLLGYLQELEQKTGAQIIVLTVETTAGVPIEEFSLKLAEKWQLGQKGKDNGALIVVAVKDRAYRIETGRGLEGPIPDAFIGRIGREYFVPNFRSGNFGKGLFDGVVVMLSRLSSEYGVSLTGLPQVPPSATAASPAPPAARILQTILVIIVVMVVLFSRFGWLFLGASMMGRRGGWSSGGGFRGGGFGSFGGGGGGSFGGGGASGRW